MSNNTPQTRTLSRAVAICGSLAALAETLDVSVEDLSRWVDGDNVPPVEAYIKSLDVVADDRCTGRA